MLRIHSSTSTLSALSALDRTQRRLSDVFKRLATGRRINSGKDDPAGLIAASRLSSELGRLEAQSRSLQRADANAAIAEGNAAQLSALFSDLNTLVIAGSNQAGLSKAEIAANQMQIDNTVASIQRFHGDAVNSLSGFNMEGTGNADVEALYDSAYAAAVSVRSGAVNDLSSGNYEAASTALRQASLDVAIARGKIGGFQKNVIGPQLRSNQIAFENLTESRSRILDTDYAVEMSNLNRLQILSASGIKVLKIAQQQSRAVLQLLGN